MIVEVVAVFFVSVCAPAAAFVLAPAVAIASVVRSRRERRRLERLAAELGIRPVRGESRRELLGRMSERMRGRIRR